MTDYSPLPTGLNVRYLVLTGAGISAESGIPTFRGQGDLWAGVPVDEVATPRGFREDPDRAWRFYSARRENVLAAAPNAAHLALAAFERRLGERLLLVTQNIDGLHTRAGSGQVVEMHGSLWRARCTGCDRHPFFDAATGLTSAPRCELCGELLRPDVVWFGELPVAGAVAGVQRFIRAAKKERSLLVFVAVGTSGQVWPAAAFVDWVRAARGSAWLVNLERAENTEAFNRFLQGPAGEILPQIFADPD